MRKSLPADSLPRGDSSQRSQRPLPGLLTAPPRALFRPATIGVFRSLNDGAQLPPLSTAASHRTEQAATLSEVDSSLALVQQDKEQQVLAKSEWESARIEELSQEIRKLLGSSSSSSNSDNKLSSDRLLAGSERSAGSAGHQDQPSPAKMPPIPNSDSVLEGLDLSQPLNLYKVPDGVMQVFVMSIQPSSPINRPYVVVRLGDQVYQTSVAKT
ncbi:hypothetical protein GGF42_003824, partial [Coemansia sp. RSA 2424]